MGGARICRCASIRARSSTRASATTPPRRAEPTALPASTPSLASAGKKGRVAFAVFPARLTPNLMLGFDVDRAVIGSTVASFPGPQERRLGGGLDVSYRFWDRYSLFAQYLISDVKNRHFQAGNDGFDHLLRVELTRSFC